MCLDRQTRSDIIKVLKVKMTILEEREHNKNEINRLQGMADVEANTENRETLERSIRFGQGKISIQTTKLLELSAAKIGRLFNVDESKVAYQWLVLKGRDFED